MWKNLLEKVDNLHEQMGHSSKDTETVRKSQVLKLETTNLGEGKNLISRVAISFKCTVCVCVCV